VGPGNYSVQVAAWGTPPGEDEPEVLVQERALSTDNSEPRRGNASKPGARGLAGDGRTTDRGFEVAPISGLPVTDRPGDGFPPCQEREIRKPIEPPEADAEALVESEPAIPDGTDEPEPEPEPEPGADPDEPPVCP
jgi:hypothetical protein